MTTTPTRPSESRRGRILIVGEGSALVADEHALPRRVSRVQTIFDAIGELSNAGPADPIDLLLLPLSLVERSSPRAIESLRRVDPAANIVIIAEAGLESDTAAWDGQVDACLSAPVRSEEIQRLLSGGSPSEPSAMPPRDMPEASPARQSAHTTETSPRVVQSAARELHPEAFDDPSNRRETQEREPHEPAADSDSSLGDTDLVDAILESPERMATVAAQLITQQTGWRDLRIGAAGETDGVAITRGGHCYGTLHSKSAPREELHRWAEWLGHWLTLDSKFHEYRLQAYTDELTGAWNRRYFNAFLERCISEASRRRRPVTVMVFDLDDFKQYNDAFGHCAGDEILRETVRLLTSVIRRGDRVCRIGGDEFAVVFADLEGPREPGSTHPDNIEQIAQRFQNEICRMHFPKLGIEAPGTLSVSAGLATYPWDGRDAASLLQHADQLALESKRRGKNVITLGPGAQRNCRHNHDAAADNAGEAPDIHPW